MPEEISEEIEALEVGEEAPPIEGEGKDDEILLARDLTLFFIKAIKAFRVYPSDNPTLNVYRDQIPKKFQSFLSKYHSFALQIGEHTLSFKGKVLYKDRDVKKSLAFFFYKDGLRELRFIEGLEEREIQGLFDIILQSGDINRLEDDLVTLMWEKDFIHIGYIATDDFLEETPVAIPENVDQFRSNLVFRPIAQYLEKDLLTEAGEEGVSLEEILSKVIVEPSPFVSNRRVYFLTPEEVEGLQKDVDAETDPTFVFSIIDILFEILAIEKEPEPYQNAANLILKAMDALLTLGDFQKATDLLKRIYIVIKTYDLKDWQIEIIKRLIIETGEEQRIERIGRILEKDERIRLEDLNSYLVLLQRNSIKYLVKLLGELKNSKTRRVLCDALADIGKDTIEMFTPFIDDPQWYLVRNITYILGRIGKEQSLPYIQKAFHHQEPRVRREAIQALGLIGGPKAISQLSKALTDPDVRIRAMAALNLGKVGKKGGLPPLLEVVQSKEFPKKEPAEIKAFFDAIGMVGSNEPIPALQQLLEKKSWLGRGKTDEIRIGAANALVMIGTPEAKAILASGRESKDEAVREACLRAVRGQSS